MPPKEVNALQGIDVLRISHQHTTRTLATLAAAAEKAAAAAAAERGPEKRGPETHTGSVFRRTGTVKKAWKETVMTLDASKPGFCVFADGAEICVKQAPVEVPWAYEEKAGQRYQFSIIDVAKTKTQEFLLAPSSSELDQWLTVLEGHGALIHRPLRAGALTFLNNKKKEEGWFVLYHDVLQMYKAKTDSKPTKVVLIAGANEFERLQDSAGFTLIESGDELASSISCTFVGPVEGQAWCDLIEQTVLSKRKNKCFNSIKEGYLSKCNADMKFWKRRYCVLMSDHIKYFKKRSDDQPAGTIGLHNGAEVEDVDDSFDSSHPNMFWVAENGDETGTRRYYMTASSPKEKDQWLQCLYSLLSNHTFRQHPASLKEGYLYHLPLGSTNIKSGKWSKQFFVLLNDKLLYFKKRTDLQPQNSIDLTQGAEFAVPFAGAESPNERLVMTLSENGDEQASVHFLRANDEKSKEQWETAISDLLAEKDVRKKPESVNEGYMYKQNKSQKWNKRYFILADDKLTYYKKKQDKSEAGEIPLPGSAELTCMTGDDPSYKWMFSIAENGDESGVRTYYVACASQALRTQWVNIITKIVKKKDSRIMMGSFVEGYLWKYPNGGGAWRKRYFVLMQNQLLYFRKRDDPSPAGSTEVKGEAQVTTIDDDPEHPYAFSVVKSGDEGEREVKVHASDAVTRDEWVRALRHQVALLAVKTKPDSLREGYVNLWTALGWRRKFFVLDKDGLKLYNKRSDQNHSTNFSFDEKTVVLLQDNKTPSLGIPVEQKGGDSTPVAAAAEAEEEKKSEEKKVEGEIGDEDTSFHDDHKSTGASILLCKNGDQNARRLRLQVIYDSEANFVADAMTVCISKEFPPKDPIILKSGYVSVRHKATGLAKADRWVSSYATLTTDSFWIYKSRDDEFPVFSADVDAAAMFYAGPVPGTAAWNPLCMTLRDSTERELSFLVQSTEEKNSWMCAVLRSIELFKEKKRPHRVDLFGGDLKTAFTKSTYYGMPGVVATCVEFLLKTPVSYCLLRSPGLHSLVRSFIQDFECFLDVSLSDPESVASCLRLYLTLLKKPVISDAVVQNLFAILSASKTPSAASDKQVTRQFQQALMALDSDSATTLMVVMRYLIHEIERPEEVHLTAERVALVWSPLLIRYKEEATNQAHGDLSQQILVVLLRNAETFFPGDFILVRKLPRKQLQKVRAENATIFNYELLRGCRYGKEIFWRFVKDNHIDEDVLFLTAVQHYKELCEDSSSTHDARLAHAREIYAKFVKQGAETQVNVADSTSKSILERLEGKNASKDLSGSEFFEAEAQAVLLINTNSWPRFKQSEGYEHWITYREKLKQQTFDKIFEIDGPETPFSGAGFDFGIDRTPTATPRGSPRGTPRHSVADEPPPPPPDDVSIRSKSPPPDDMSSHSNPPPPPNDVSIRSHPMNMDEELGSVAAPDLAQANAEASSSLPRVPARQAPAAPAPTRSMKNSASSTLVCEDSPTSETFASITLVGDDLPPPPPELADEVWFTRKTTKGVSYYIHTVTKATTYQVPDALIFSYSADGSGKMCFVNNRDDSVSYEVPEALRQFASTYKLLS